MKVLKKILKLVAFLGAMAGVAKIACEICKVNAKVEQYNQKAKFTGKEIKYDEEPFEKDSIAATFSGVEVDFREATMANKSSVLDIFGRFSGIEIVVPEHWHVEADGVQVSSGINNNTFDNSENEVAPVLNINYDLKFSGLNIKNKKIVEEVEEIVEEVEEIVEEVNLNEAEDLEADEEELEIEVIEETYE